MKIIIMLNFIFDHYQDFIIIVVVIIARVIIISKLHY